MSLNLYDLLDVDEDATAEEIRAAWKDAIGDLDPTDRRFRAYNDAAAVLLDEEKRAAYDAELAAARADEDAGAEATEGTVAPADETAATPADTEAVQAAEPDPAPAAEDEHAEDEPAEEEPAGEEPARAGEEEEASGASGPPTWALLVAAGVAVLSIACLVLVWSWPGSRADAPPGERGERAREAAGTVEDAAAQMVPAVLSYDYRTIDADLEAAEVYLTDEFAEERADLFAQRVDSGMTLRDQVIEEKVVVTSTVSNTGLTRVSEDGGRAVVVVYVNQDSKKGRAEPSLLRMWATLTLVRSGDGWLLDDICTEGDCF